MAQSHLVLLTPSHDVRQVVRHLVGLVGRGTFPVHLLADGHESCAFLFNDLLASDEGGDTVATWILTADALTYADFGFVEVRLDMIEDGTPSASEILFKDYEQTWYHFPDIGVAAMPMAVLRDHAASKGWARVSRLSGGMRRRLDLARAHPPSRGAVPRRADDRA